MRGEGGFIAGEKIFFVGKPQTFPSGSKLTPGQAGEILGPKDGDDSRLKVQFEGNPKSTNCLPHELSSTKP